jgi:mRNA interferase MazF
MDPPAGHRPVVLLSRDESYAARMLVTVAPVTTTIRRIRSEVRLGPGEGLSRPSVANLDTITTIPKDSLLERVGVLDAAKLEALDAALRFALGL